MTALSAIPLCLLAIGLAVPILLLDAGNEYLSFLWANPRLVVLTLACWGVLFHWTVRRLAEVLLLRSSGAKLRVRHEA